MGIIHTGTVNNLSNEECTYKIVDDLNYQDLMAYDVQSRLYYMNLFNKLHTEYEEEDRNEIIDSLMLEDHHWDWSKKAYSIQNDTSYQQFSLVIEDEIQATCIIYQPKKSCCQAADIFYIEYISVAPWNRSIKIIPRQYKGLATILITNILEYAINKLKLLPGFGLHSLPQASDYYDKVLGMHKYPTWDKPPMAYFELSCENAIALLNRTI